MDITAGYGHAFTFTTPDNYLDFPAVNASSKYTWAVCPAQIYSAGYYVDTLVYREAGVQGNDSCADVKVKAVF